MECTIRRTSQDEDTGAHSKAQFKEKPHRELLEHLGNVPDSRGCEGKTRSQGEEGRNPGAAAAQPAAAMGGQLPAS